MASTHRSPVTTAKIRDAGFKTLEYPPYLLDLAPSDLYIFPVVATLKQFLAAPSSMSRLAAGLGQYKRLTCLSMNVLSGEAPDITTKVGIFVCNQTMLFMAAVVSIPRA
ncbi:hypothetical protein EVAR_28136_1 [Eumeta japonica]|uniref:Histone-lysine N-methyltransferase SETMAR n=1 Tax=Eumeta variegata TaxID=151549 RepID=A0A4C1VGF1_EUMVA|nr:hypothetical protein EVAR_28136_1 [Eumeta japonica]